MRRAEDWLLAGFLSLAGLSFAVLLWLRAIDRAVSLP